MPSESTPSIAALLIGLMPFAAMCFSVSLWDRIEPMLFGFLPAEKVGLLFSDRQR